MKNYILSFLFVSSLLFANACKSPKSTDQDQPTSLGTENTLSVSSQVSQSTIYYNMLMDSFNPNWESEEPAPNDYPEYFGGAFIDNDGGFVVSIVGNIEEHRGKIAGIIGTDNFTTESCKYSYREMMEVMDNIDLFLSSPSVPEDHIVIQNFAGAMADVLENRVVVNMIEVTPELVKAFKQDISSSDLVFIQQGELPSFE